MGVEMTTKCADWINMNKYVELEHYLVYIKDNGHNSDNGVYCVNKETGERESLYRGVPCIENLCGVSDILYVFNTDYYLKINVVTREVERGDVFVSGSNPLFGSGIRELNVQCNEKYILYQTGHSSGLNLINVSTGVTEKVRDINNKWFKVDNYRLWGDKIYFVSGNEISVYDIKNKEISLLHTFKEGRRVWVYLTKLNECASNYDDATVDIYDNTLFIAQYEEKTSAHIIEMISLDGSGDVEEIELDTMTAAEEITRKVIKSGKMYYATKNSEAMIVKYDLYEEEETILEEKSACVVRRESGRWNKEISYYAGDIQIVGKWLYYRNWDNSDDIYRIPIDGGDCVRVKVTE